MKDIDTSNIQILTHSHGLLLSNISLWDVNKMIVDDVWCKKWVSTMTAASTQPSNSFPTTQQAQSSSPFIDCHRNKKSNNKPPFSHHITSVSSCHNDREIFHLLSQTPPRQPKPTLESKQIVLSSSLSMNCYKSFKLTTLTSI